MKDYEEFYEEYIKRLEEAMAIVEWNMSRESLKEAAKEIKRIAKDLSREGDYDE